MGAVYTKEELKQRLGPPDIVQIRLLLRVPPERRVAKKCNSFGNS